MLYIWYNGCDEDETAVSSDYYNKYYHCDVLLIDDFTKIFLTYSQITELQRKLEIAYKIPYKLNAFVIILKDIIKEDFMKLLEQHTIKETILFNPYEY